MSTRLIISDAQIVPEGILIKKMEIIDTVSGISLRIAKLTPQLLNFLMQLEIGTDDYFALQKMQESNPLIKKLCETFKTYTI
jgi:hypothetical protein